MEETCRWSTIFFFAVLTSVVACSAENKTQLLRFWLDEYAFSPGETTILREEIEEAGSNVAVLAGESRDAFRSVRGYYSPDLWDVYWTGRQGCMQALPHAEPGHKISCVPGLHEVTMKDRLVARLTQFYGEGAFNIIPRSYLLPTQYWPWRMWLAAQGSEERGEMWVLKQEVHRGKGVHVMPLARATEEAKVRKLDQNYDLVQAYIGNQLTVLGRKFYIRLWAVVTASFPLRAYLFDGGVVVFGNSTPDDRAQMTSDDFIVNLWHLGRTTEAPPWSVAEFCTYLDNLSGSQATFDKLWLDMRVALGLTFAAGVQSMRFSAASFPVAAAGATFELVGIDFLVDEHMKPWLLEVNAVPSLARKVINCEKQPEGCTADGEAESVFDVEKERLVHSLFRLLQATAGTAAHRRNGTVPRPPTLADYMARWRSNATDLAAMNASNASLHSSVSKHLGWTPVQVQEGLRELASGDKQSGRSLENSGRELKAEKESAEGEVRDQGGSGLAEQDGGLGSAPVVEEHITRKQSVADATNLRRYLPETGSSGAISSVDEEARKRQEEAELEDHLMEDSIKEVEVALANHFLPLMMLPEAAQYSSEHQTRGHIHPQPAHKHSGILEGHPGLWSGILLPFRPVVSAYGGLAGILERLRVGIVLTMPEINNDVTMGVAKVIPGADWLILRGYQLFGWGDRVGIVEAMSVLPKHKLDQRLSDHIRHVTLQSDR